MNKDDILHIASLARLELTEDEIASFPQQIDAILSFVDQVKDADTDDGVVRDMQNYNSFREDVADGKIDPSRDAVIDGFPDRQDDYLKVSKILSN